jgi:hypothetical protein
MGGEEEQLSHLYFLMEKAEFFEQRKMEYFNKSRRLFLVGETCGFCSIIGCFSIRK